MRGRGRGGSAAPSTRGGAAGGGKKRARDFTAPVPPVRDTNPAEAENTSEVIEWGAGAPKWWYATSYVFFMGWIQVPWVNWG